VLRLATSPTFGNHQHHHQNSSYHQLAARRNTSNSSLGSSSSASASSSTGYSSLESARREMPWLHGDIDRAEAERRLKAGGMQDGLFLVRCRGSASDVNNNTTFALSVCQGGVVEHRIVQQAEHLDGTKSNHFQVNNHHLKSCKTLVDLVDFLQRRHPQLAIDVPLLREPLLVVSSSSSS
jgi:hypothetical protein